MKNIEKDEKIRIGHEAYLLPVTFEDESQELYKASEIYSLAEKRFELEPIRKKQKSNSQIRKNVMMHITRSLAKYKVEIHNKGEERRPLLYYPKEAVKEYLENNTEYFLKIKALRQEELTDTDIRRYESIPKTHYAHLLAERDEALKLIEEYENYQSYENTPIEDIPEDALKEQLVEWVTASIIREYIINNLIEIDVNAIKRDVDLLYDRDKNDDNSEYAKFAAARIARMDSYWKPRH